MSIDLLVGIFANETDLLGAAHAARQRRLPVHDAFTPYPVHGLDEAMGLKPSRLGFVCFACGLAGVITAMTLQHWTMAIDWPINVGGRPFNSWPAFVPVAFELLVLFAGFGVVFAFFAVSRLFPGNAAHILEKRASDDRFVLAIEVAGEAIDTEAVFAMFRGNGAVAIERREATTTPRAAWPASSRAANIVLIVLFAVGIVLNWTLSSDHRKPNMEFLPEMVRAVSQESYAPHKGLANNMVLQAPPDGSIARGQLPLHYQSTPEEAQRAGEELRNPFTAGDKRWQPRGAQVYANYCALCHGTEGAGDGPVSKRGVPPPPTLLADKAVKIKDGQLFHIITYGQTNMAAYAGQIEPNDRWAAILHVRQLQKAKGGGP